MFHLEVFSQYLINSLKTNFDLIPVTNIIIKLQNCFSAESELKNETETQKITMSQLLSLKTGVNPTKRLRP